MKTPTINQFKAWAKEYHDLAIAVCQAKAFAQVERDRVDAYIKPLLADFSLKDDDGNYITEPNAVYLCNNEEQVKEYFEACDREHRKHGFTGPHGHCPALIAENLQMDAEQALIQAGAILFGMAELHVYGEDRKNILNILLGACINSQKNCEVAQ